jgi:hypothetical protein
VSVEINVRGQRELMISAPEVFERKPSCIVRKVFSMAFAPSPSYLCIVPLKLHLMRLLPGKSSIQVARSSLERKSKRDNTMAHSLFALYRIRVGGSSSAIYQSVGMSSTSSTPVSAIYGNRLKFRTATVRP